MKSLSARAFSVILPVALTFFGLSTWLAYASARESEIASSMKSLAQDRFLARQSMQLRFNAIALSHERARQRILDQLDGSVSPSLPFDSYFPAFGDGTRRSADSLWVGQDVALGSVKGFGAYIADEEITSERRRTITAAFSALANFVDGLPANVSNIYFFSPDNDLIMFAPERSDQLLYYRRDAPANFDFQKEEFSVIVSPAVNPDGEMRCTSLRPILYDETKRTWTTGCMTPVRSQAGHVGAVGSSILLDELFMDNDKVTMEGVTRVVITRDGQLISHPDFTVQSSVRTLDFLDLTRTSDAKLKAIWNALNNDDAALTSGYLPDADIYIDAQQLDQPEWIVVSFMSGETIRSNAFAASRPILISGLLGTALFALFIVVFVRRSLTGPIEQLADRVDGISALHKADGIGLGKSGTELERLNIAFDALETRVARERLRLTRSFDQLVDAIEEYAILLLAPDGHVLRANSAAKDRFGWVEGRPIAQIMGGDEATAQQLLADVSKTGRVSQAVQRKRGDGKDFWAFEAFEPMQDDSGALIGFAYVGRDMTGQKQAEAAIIAARDEASAQLAARTNILATISHEIRTPLGGLLGIIDQLKNERSDAERSRALILIEDSCGALLDTLDAILQQTRGSHGDAQYESRRFRPSAIARRVSELFRPLARRKGIRIETLASGEREAMGDPARVQQVLANLVSNAVKFTQSGSVTIDIQPPAIAGEDWSFEVSDTGAGIDGKRLEKIFDPYDTSHFDSLGKSVGAGLGLSITRDIVKTMGGQIRVESEVGRGTLFRVLLPLEAVPDEFSPDKPASSEGSLYLDLDKATEQIQAEAQASGLGWKVIQPGEIFDEASIVAERLLIITSHARLPLIDDGWLSASYRIVVVGTAEGGEPIPGANRAKIVLLPNFSVAHDLPHFLERAHDGTA
ncbi:PAS domain-containing sensor histidine kinase [Erythrobacter sp. R86502]|uniref:ATP-binding response regulator n=1 Tax=Erythrobacter sp. R86502 TaxID=3093846 RepID=UPI0036D21A80